MRITNLHLIVSFFILSALGFVGYRTLRQASPIPSFPAIPSLDQNNPQPETAPTPSLPPPARRADAFVEQSREEAKQSLEKALDVLEAAMSRESRVGRQFIAYRRARDLFDRAETVEDLNQVKTMSEEVVRELSSPVAKLKAYVVRRGDSLWKIAKKKEVYGRGSAWVRIWRANEDQVPDFDILIAGQKLTIPR
jgi:nucleoid-associated protein YgaU